MIIHIRSQQLNSRKSITTIEGFDSDIDTLKICKTMKKLFACNGSLQNIKNDPSVIVLQGDQRYKARDFLNTISIADDIFIHG